MTININNIEIDKTKINTLISNRKKLHAIKIVKKQLNIGLYDSKIIVNNLTQNPNFYDVKPHSTGDDIQDFETEIVQPLARKGSHMISDKSSKIKDAITVILIIGIVILSIIYFNS